MRLRGEGKLSLPAICYYHGLNAHLLKIIADCENASDEVELRAIERLAIENRLSELGEGFLYNFGLDIDLFRDGIAQKNPELTKWGRNELEKLFQEVG